MAAYSPESKEEREYYDLLFCVADEDGQERLHGQAAVTFFQKSGLPVEDLKQIWDLSDRDGKGFLTRDEFYLSMRLISLRQAGLDLSDSTPTPLAKLEGCPDPPPLPSIPSDVWEVAEEQIAKYEQAFKTLDSDGDGFVMGGEAVPVFKLSGLPRETLKSIWSVCDRGNKGKLDEEEFLVAMQLTYYAKGGRPIPRVIPLSLIDAISKLRPEKKKGEKNQGQNSDFGDFSTMGNLATDATGGVSPPPAALTADDNASFSSFPSLPASASLLSVKSDANDLLAFSPPPPSSGSKQEPTVPYPSLAPAPAAPSSLSTMRSDGNDLLAFPSPPAPSTKLDASAPLSFQPPSLSSSTSLASPAEAYPPKRIKKEAEGGDRGRNLLLEEVDALSVILANQEDLLPLASADKTEELREGAKRTPWHNSMENMVDFIDAEKAIRTQTLSYINELLSTSLSSLSSLKRELKAQEEELSDLPSLDSMRAERETIMQLIQRIAEDREKRVDKTRVTTKRADEGEKLLSTLTELLGQLKEEQRSTSAMYTSALTNSITQRGQQQVEETWQQKEKEAPVPRAVGSKGSEASIFDSAFSFPNSASAASSGFSVDKAQSSSIDKSSEKMEFFAMSSASPPSVPNSSSQSTISPVAAQDQDPFSSGAQQRVEVFTTIQNGTGPPFPSTKLMAVDAFPDFDDAFPDGAEDDAFAGFNEPPTFGGVVPEKDETEKTPAPAFLPFPSPSMGETSSSSYDKEKGQETDYGVLACGSLPSPGAAGFASFDAFQTDEQRLDRPPSGTSTQGPFASAAGPLPVEGFAAFESTSAAFEPSMTVSPVPTAGGDGFTASSVTGPTVSNEDAGSKEKGDESLAPFEVNWS